MTNKNLPVVEVHPLSDVVPDDNNVNEHTVYGSKLLENSMRKRGFFRPIAAAGKGVDKPMIKAGSLTQETAMNIGLDEDAIFIYTDGTRPIVHVRTDIAPDSPEALALGIEDNQIGFEGYAPNDDKLAELMSDTKFTEFIQDDKTLNTLLAEMNGAVSAMDYQDLDDENESMAGMEDVSITITFPAKHKEEIIKWLAHDEPRTSAGLGRGVMKQIGIL